MPRIERAQVENRKLLNYELDLDHPEGGPKAVFFRDVLGIARADWRFLRDQLLEAIRVQPYSRVSRRKHGDIYVVPVDVAGRNGRTVGMQSVWEVKPGEGPRLVTVYPT